jgi:hypothetical protein
MNTFNPQDYILTKDGVMNAKTLKIQHLIKTLAEQLRKAEDGGLACKNGIVGASKERAQACKAASKAVADLEKLGVDYNTSFDWATSLNEATAAYF